MDVSVYSAPWGKTSIHLFSKYLPNVFFLLSAVPGPGLEQTSCPSETYTRPDLSTSLVDAQVNFRRIVEIFFRCTFDT